MLFGGNMATAGASRPEHRHLYSPPAMSDPDPDDPFAQPEPEAQVPMSAADWQAVPAVRRRPDRSRRGCSGMGLARTTIPIALVLAVMLPLLGIGWFLLPESAPLKVGRPRLAMALIGFGLFCGLAAALLMRSVARRVQGVHRPASH